MIVIVGAGISGLTLAHELHARGVEHVVLERSDRVGGVIRSGRVEGRLLEWGPQRARMTPDFARLIDELALRERVIEAPRDLPLFVYRASKLRRVPFSLRELVTSDLLPWSARLRVLAEPLTAAPRDDETVGAVFRRKLGRHAYEALAGPLYGGLYASDPDDMIVGLSLRHTLRDLGVRRSLLTPLLRRGGGVRTSAAVSFIDGLEELPRALHDRHRDRIRLNTPVRALAAEGRRWSIELDGETLSADHVVMTTPTWDAGEMTAEALRDTAPRITRLSYNPVTLVHVEDDARLRGLGYQVALDEEMVTRGVTFNDALFGRGVSTIFLGGARNRWIASAGDDELKRIALDELERVTGARGRVLSVHRTWMPAWDRTWALIDGMELPPGLHVHANWHARPGLPGRLAGSRRLAEKLAGA